MPKSMRINPNTKYYPPRMLEKLELVQSYPFTFLEAPSGFGKTTLLEHFFEVRIAPSVPRYYFDFESDEPLSIWRQICQRIGKIDAACGERLQKSGPPDEDNRSEIHEALQELCCPEECYLWLDNYKRWDNRYSGEFLNQLAHHGGRELHIIVSTQPLNPEKRLRLEWTSSSWQIREEDLMFRPDEIEAYFRAAGFPLTQAQTEQAYQLTEGWIMALSLQMLCYMEHGRFAQGGMTTLMEHAFWERLSERERDFFLHISIFPKFSLSQAAALAGLSGTATMPCGTSVISSGLMPGAGISTPIPSFGFCSESTLTVFRPNNRRRFICRAAALPNRQGTGCARCGFIMRQTPGSGSWTCR